MTACGEQAQMGMWSGGRQKVSEDLDPLLTEASTKTPLGDQTTNVLKMVVLFKTYNATEFTEVVGASSMLCDT